VPDQPFADPIAAVVRRTPELYEYLRCDTELADPLMKTMVGIVCAMMRP
jgi:hypothetical protein